MKFKSDNKPCSKYTDTYTVLCILRDLLKSTQYKNTNTNVVIFQLEGMDN